ncbi:unnamed protein product [Pedinophyceae sp. YPF-701]|nr:unnamed protein product [Pedinophyceae sp. YPF-701]
MNRVARQLSGLAASHLRLQAAEYAGSAPPAAASDTAEVDASAEEPASPVPKKWDHWLDVTGRVDGQYEVAKQQCFAIVEIGSHQYKVTADDVVYSLYIPGLDVNDKVNLKRVLLLGNPTETRIGRPVVADAHCEAVVEEVFKDAKKHIFRFRKKSHRKYKTVRPLFTKLRITKVHGIDG